MDSIPKGDKSNDSLSKSDNSSSLSQTPITKSPSDKSTSDVKTENMSKHLDKSVDRNKTESADEKRNDSRGKTPPSSAEKEGNMTTPGKPKSKRRLAAKFDFAPSAPWISLPFLYLGPVVQSIFSVTCCYRKNSKYWDMYNWANSVDSDQTAVKEQSDQDLQCLPFCLHLLEAFLHRKIKLFYIKDNYGSWSGCPNI